MTFADALKVELGSEYFAGVLKTGEEDTGFYVVDLSGDEKYVIVASLVSSSGGYIWKYVIEDQEVHKHVRNISISVRKCFVFA